MKLDYNPLKIGNVITLKNDKITWEITDLKTGVDNDSGEKYWNLTLSNGMGRTYYLWLLESSDKITGIYTRRNTEVPPITVAVGSLPWAMQMLIEGKKVRGTPSEHEHYMYLKDEDFYMCVENEHFKFKLEGVKTTAKWELAE